ncbi:MAG: glycosyltransferase [Clostridiales bacterium]
MKRGLNIAFFASSLVSAYWNGAATYYRGIIKALHQRGHNITFYEPNAFERQQHRDIDDPDYAKSIVYKADEKSLLDTLNSAAGSDLVIKASGVGVFDELLEEKVLELQSASTMVAFWDVDAPATLDRVMNNPDDTFNKLIPKYNFILTYGGGDPVIKAYEKLGARKCLPVYNALDPSTHFPVSPDERFKGILGFLGNRMPDRELRVWEFFLNPAQKMPNQTFILGGSGWVEWAPEVKNVKFIGHVYTQDHNAFNCSQLAVLNINRESMARYGFSPATRVFEAAGAGACIITDNWEGIELFLKPDEEILVAHSGDQVVAILKDLTEDKARKIGKAAMRRVLSEHTYSHRSEQLENLFYKEAELQPAGRTKL